MSAPAVNWPLIGRDQELQAIALARADPACIGLILRAPAGVGKSRLARAASELAASEGALVEWVQATSSAAAVPLAAVAMLVPDEVRSGDAVQLLHRCAEALRERAGRRAVLLVVEDAHLLDPLSATLVRHLAMTSASFVLATVREGAPLSDAIVSLAKDGTARRLELGELSPADVRLLVEAALGDPVEEAAARWVVEVSRGNALYVRELVGGAVEAGTLVHEAGLWRLHGRPAAARSLIELVEQRLAGLSAAEREAIELLALAEPLHLDELTGLSSETTALELEARGLIELREDDVGLTHPLYGEAVRRALPSLRARVLRTRLAAALLAREPFTADDALRVARLHLDAGTELPPELLLDAARAANRSGDPELGAELAGRATGLPAAMVLAQAHTMRNRHQDAETALAAAEPLAPGHPQATEYFRQRAEVLHWGLRASSELAALFARAQAWSDTARWIDFIARLERTYAALSGGVPRGDLDEIGRDSRVSEASRRGGAAVRALSMLLAGQGDEAAGLAWDARPSIPLRDTGASAALAVTAATAMETGNRWRELDAYMADCVRAGVRASDHDAAGIAALTLAQLYFCQARYRDSARWLAEADIHLQLQDTWGAITGAQVLHIGIAYFTRDFDAATAASDRLEAAVKERQPVPTQLASLARGRGWAARMSSDVEAGRRLLRDADELAGAPGLAARVAYEALRTGVSATSQLEQLGQVCTSRLVSAYAAHATARAAHDGGALLEVAAEFRAIGADSYALEAATEAAAAFRQEGRQDSARRATHLARQLHHDDQGGAAPRLEEGVATVLTRREEQLVELASQGLSNAEIADRLVLSVRTVETHLYRAMQKLGVSDRRDL